MVILLILIEGAITTSYVMVLWALDLEAIMLGKNGPNRQKAGNASISRTR